MGDSDNTMRVYESVLLPQYCDVAMVLHNIYNMCNCGLPDISTLALGHYQDMHYKVKPALTSFLSFNAMSLNCSLKGCCHLVITSDWLKNKFIRNVTTTCKYTYCVM